MVSRVWDRQNHQRWNIGEIYVQMKNNNVAPSYNQGDEQRSLVLVEDVEGPIIGEGLIVRNFDLGHSLDVPLLLRPNDSNPGEAELLLFELGQVLGVPWRVEKMRYISLFVNF